MTAAETKTLIDQTVAMIDEWHRYYAARLNDAAELQLDIDEAERRLALLRASYLSLTHKRARVA